MVSVLFLILWLALFLWLVIFFVNCHQIHTTINYNCPQIIIISLTKIKARKPYWHWSIWRLSYFKALVKYLGKIKKMFCYCLSFLNSVQLNFYWLISLPWKTLVYKLLKKWLKILITKRLLTLYDVVSR